MGISKDRFRTATSMYTMCTDDVHLKRMLHIKSFLVTLCGDEFA